MIGLLDFGAEDGAGAEELVLAEAGDDVGQREIELLHGEEAGVAEGDQGSAGGDEIAQRLRAGVADAAGILAGDGAGLHAVEDLAGGHLGDEDGVVAVAEMAVLDVGVVQDGEGEVVLLEDPAGPAFIDHAHPGFVEADARLLHGPGGGGFFEGSGIDAALLQDRIRVARWCRWCLRFWRS